MCGLILAGGGALALALLAAGRLHRRMRNTHRGQRSRDLPPSSFREARGKHHAGGRP